MIRLVPSGLAPAVRRPDPALRQRAAEQRVEHAAQPAVDGIHGHQEHSCFFKSLGEPRHASVAGHRVCSRPRRAPGCRLLGAGVPATGPMLSAKRRTGGSQYGRGDSQLQLRSTVSKHTLRIKIPSHFPLLKTRFRSSWVAKRGGLFGVSV